MMLQTKDHYSGTHCCKLRQVIDCDRCACTRTAWLAGLRRLGSHQRGRIPNTASDLPAIATA